MSKKKDVTEDVRENAVEENVEEVVKTVEVEAKVCLKYDSVIAAIGEKFNARIEEVDELIERGLIIVTDQGYKNISDIEEGN